MSSRVQVLAEFDAVRDAEFVANVLDEAAHELKVGNDQGKYGVLRDGERLRLIRLLTKLSTELRSAW